LQRFADERRVRIIIHRATRPTSSITMGLRSLSAAWRKPVRIGDALILNLKTQKKIAFALQIRRHDLAETFRHRGGKRQYRNN
jgi:hypothetical protein